MECSSLFTPASGLGLTHHEVAARVRQVQVMPSKSEQLLATALQQLASPTRLLPPMFPSLTKVQVSKPAAQLIGAAACSNLRQRRRPSRPNEERRASTPAPAIPALAPASTLAAARALPGPGACGRTGASPRGAEAGCRPAAKEDGVSMTPPSPSTAKEDGIRVIASPSTAIAVAVGGTPSPSTAKEDEVGMTPAAPKAADPTAADLLTTASTAAVSP